jgi:putative spermidine/putrescine transport system permease protein
VTAVERSRVGGPAPPREAPQERSRWPWTLLALAMIALLLAPFAPLVLASFAEGYFHPQVFPERWSTRAWSIVLASDGGAWRALRETVVIASAVTAVSLVLAVPAGRVLGTHHLRGRTVIELLLLAPVLVPSIAVAIGIHVVFIRLGLDGGLLGVVLVHLIPATPYVALLSAGVFANLDTDQEAQARSLGAGRLQVLLHVTTPLVAPGLAIAALFGFLVSWGQYTLTLVIGGGQVVTLPILLFASASGGDASVTAATALFHGLPAVVLLLVSARLLGGTGTVALGGAR